MVRSIIFDLYGVLAVDGWQAFESTHFTDHDVLDQVFQLRRQVDAGLSDYAELVRLAAEAIGENEETVRYQLEHTALNTNLLELIHRDLLGRYKLGILSNASNKEVIKRFFTLEQQQLFDVIMLSHDVGVSKPDVQLYELMAEKLDVSVETCLFIDDSERHVIGARDAGMQALLYTIWQVLERI